jgi:hypothetical protein
MTENLVGFWGNTLQPLQLPVDAASLLPNEDARFLCEVGLPTNELIYSTIQAKLQTSPLKSKRWDEAAVTQHDLYFEFAPNAISVINYQNHTFIVIGRWSSSQIVIRSLGGVYLLFDEPLSNLAATNLSPQLLFLNSTVEQFLHYIMTMMSFVLKTNELYRQYGELVDKNRNENNNPQLAAIAKTINAESKLMLKKFIDIDTQALLKPTSWWLMHLQTEGAGYMFHV